MTDYDLMLITFNQMDLNFKAHESMEFIDGGMRRILWIYVSTPIGVLGFKFDTHGSYEAMYEMVKRDELQKEM